MSSAWHNKTTKPVPESNNRICSQSACQYYHDFVYGPRAADGGRKVSACFAEVNQYMARQAEERVREQQQREQAAQREKQRQQEEAERAKRAAERAAWEAREQKRKQEKAQKEREAEARLKTAKDESARRQIQAERDKELAAIARERSTDITQLLLPPPVPPKAAVGASTVLEPNRDVPPEPPPPPPLGKEALAEIKADPFSGKSRYSSPAATLANPSEWRDPFPSRTTITKDLHADEVFAKTTEIAAKGTEKALSMLDRDIEVARKAGNNMKYLEAAEDTRSVVNGMGKMLKYAGYAAATGNIVNAETDKQREQAIGEAAWKVSSDIVKQGFEKYAPRIFGEKVAAVLLGPVAFVASIGMDVLTRTPITRDPQEIIRDQSGF